MAKQNFGPQGPSSLVCCCFLLLVFLERKSWRMWTFLFSRVEPWALPSGQQLQGDNQGLFLEIRKDDMMLMILSLFLRIRHELIWIWVVEYPRVPDRVWSWYVMIHRWDTLIKNPGLKGPQTLSKASLRLSKDEIFKCLRPQQRMLGRSF